MEKQTINNNIEYFTRLFQENRQFINKNGNGLLNSPREEALEKFSRLGIPAKKNENYKYTDLTPLFSNDYKYFFDPEKIIFNVDDVFKCDVPELDTEVVILLNGFYYSRNKLITEYENGIIIGSLSEASKKYPEIVGKHYRKYAHDEKEGLVALNSAFSLDGVFIYFP